MNGRKRHQALRQHHPLYNDTKHKAFKGTPSPYKKTPELNNLGEMPLLYDFLLHFISHTERIDGESTAEATKVGAEKVG